MAHTSIDDVILKIHSAPLEPEGWETVMRSLMDMCGAQNALMLTVGATKLPTIKYWQPSLNFDPAALSDYALHWASQDLLYQGALEKGRIRSGLVSTEAQLVGQREYLRSAYFNEFCKPHDLYSHLNVCLSEGMPNLCLGPSAITLYRGEATESFAEAQCSILRRLAPHLSLAARTTWHVESLAIVEPMYRQALDEIRIPLFGLSSAGKVVLVNSAGDSLLSGRRWVAVTGNALVATSDVIEADAFRVALSRLRSGSGTSLLLTDGASWQQAVMTTVPAQNALQVRVANKPVTGFVWIVPCSPEVASVKSLGQLFELTPAEVKLLQKLVYGTHLSDAAEQLQITRNTARTQLKAIFRKTGQRTQGQLLALANRMAMIRANV